LRTLTATNSAELKNYCGVDDVTVDKRLWTVSVIGDTIHNSAPCCDKALVSL